MTTRIGFFSDPHAAAEPVAEALALFRCEGVDRILCGGDIAGYGAELAATVDLIHKAGCECVAGNHDLWYLERHRGENPVIDRFLASLPAYLHLTIERRSVYLVHAHPPCSNRGGIKLRDKSGQIAAESVDEWRKKLAPFNYDLLLVGHTHQVYEEGLGNTWVVNPGSCRYNHACSIISLPELSVEWFPLSGKAITPQWNWGMSELEGDT